MADGPIVWVVQRMKIIYVSKWQMDQTLSLCCPKNENHLCFIMADGPDHCPSNENHLGFKVADGPDHSLVCPKNKNHQHIFC